MSKAETKAPAVQDDVTPKNAFKKLKKPALTLAFIAINVAVIAITAFSEFGNSENAAQLSEVQINWWFLLPAAACFIVAITLEIHKYIIMVREAAKVNMKNQIKKVWRVARRTVLLGKYYDSVTPAAIGGQPFQIWYMHKNAGIGKGMATTIPIIGMISNQIGFIIVASVAFLFGSLSINNAVLMATACFGLLFYAFWPIAILIATFLPNTTAELVNLIVKFLAKIHIVKDKKKAIKKVSDGVNEYAKCVKQILKTRGLFLREILLSVCFHLLISMIPFFVLTAFGGAVDFLPCLVTTIAVTSAVYFVPTPGNAGAAEGTFFVVFSALSSGYIFWAMLTWRFFSYYIYIIIGAIIYVRMHFEKKKNKTHEEKLDT